MIFFIIGGGPSLDLSVIPRLQGRGKVIAINNAYIHAPWADVLFWADRKWFDWNGDDIHRHTGPHKITRAGIFPYPPGITVMNYLARSWSTWPGSVGGLCSGSSAINLAVLMGARVIILLGFDMRDVGNWHNFHRRPTQPGQHRNKFIPVLESFVPHLAAAGVTVINTNARSALRCFPFADIEAILQGDLTATFPSFDMPGSIVDFAAVRPSLWQLPDDIEPSDYGTATHVVERIPHTQLDVSMRNIARLSRFGARFEIATDRPEQWRRTVENYFHIVDVVEKTERSIILFARK